MGPRFAISVLFLANLLLMARILFDAPTGRSRVSDLFSESVDGYTEHAVRLAIAIDEANWSRAETVTIQAFVIGGLGLLGTGAAFYFAGKKATRSKIDQSE